MRFSIVFWVPHPQNFCTKSILDLFFVYQSVCLSEAGFFFKYPWWYYVVLLLNYDVQLFLEFLKICTKPLLDHFLVDRPTVSLSLSRLFFQEPMQVLSIFAVNLL